ncbi:MAG: DUF5615 family PIN-like protein [Saprospiraceae bacterium]|nr:DUF5615 family PIN-like protein [Saprospiraceae bacterium]MCF8251267.1 DUF5615 family PIN-like protein [Saprospiraceae bacterium]MCF8280842.1 DUF5615 family PIN-like protein [Bacteroidales bacterium]MCF8311804.1 DUF5615 family PIN-like protein [Saprospiraceae bacterium]MCF8441945.1 DUF5615 family PIN-like protein [Saprospiraceae bacterium]
MKSNLSPLWVDAFANAGWEAKHWSSIGEHHAPDPELMAWAKENGYIVFTHDLDFSAILAATKAAAPSVFQVRTQDVMPSAIAGLVISNLIKFQVELEAGALITLNEIRGKARILPF